MDNPEKLIAALKRRIAAANLKLAEADKEAQKAERKRDRAWSHRERLRDELGEALLASWGDGEPDWPLLLTSEGPGGMTLYRACMRYLECIGFAGSGGAWSDTGQVAVSIAINAGDVGAVARIASGIRRILPYIHPHSDNRAWFSLSTRQDNDCAWTLRVTPDECAALIRENWGTATQALHFDTLEDALRHIQDNLWYEVILEHEQGLLIDHDQEASA